jgi:predicted secreted Zn-dependent protease
MSQQEIIEILEKHKGVAISTRDLEHLIPNTGRNTIRRAFVRLRRWAEKANNCPIKSIPATLEVKFKDPRGFNARRVMRITRLVYLDD